MMLLRDKLCIEQRPCLLALNRKGEVKEVNQTIGFSMLYQNRRPSYVFHTLKAIFFPLHVFFVSCPGYKCAPEDRNFKASA